MLADFTVGKGLNRGVNPGGMGGTRPPPQFLDWGDEYLIVPHFFICSMKFNSTLFSVYCGNSIVHAYTILFLFQFPAMLLIDY